MAEQEKALNETVAGGHYIGVDGKPHDAEGNPVSGGKSAAKSGGSKESTDWESMTVEELEAETEGMEIEGTGSNGRVLKADMVAALQQRDAGK